MQEICTQASWPAARAGVLVGIEHPRLPKAVPGPGSMNGPSRAAAFPRTDATNPTETWTPV